MFERKHVKCQADVSSRSGNLIIRGLAKRRRLLDQDLRLGIGMKNRTTDET